MWVAFARKKPSPTNQTPPSTAAALRPKPNFPCATTSTTSHLVSLPIISTTRRRKARRQLSSRQPWVRPARYPPFPIPTLYAWRLGRRHHVVRWLWWLRPAEQPAIDRQHLWGVRHEQQLQHRYVGPASWIVSRNSSLEVQASELPTPAASVPTTTVAVSSGPITSRTTLEVSEAQVRCTAIPFAGDELAGHCAGSG